MNDRLVHWREELGSSRRVLRRFGLRALILLLLLIAAMVPSCRFRGGEETLGVLVDVSGSVSLAAVGSVVEILEDGSPQALVAFADHPEPLAGVGELRDLELLDRDAGGARLAGAGPDAVDRQRTDLERALRTGLEQVPSDGSGRLLLISDGNATHGRLERALPLAQKRRVRIDTLPLPPDRQAPRIVGLDVPSDAAVGSPVTATVRVASGQPEAMVVEVRVGEQEASTVPLDHPGNGPMSVPLILRFEEAGLRPVALRLLPGEGPSTLSSALPSRWRSTVRVGDRPRILLVESGPRTPLWSELRRRGLDLERRAVDAAPSVAADFRSWRVVVLHDVDANDLGPRRMSALAAWVRSGGSLFFASGESSYGEDGYNDTAIAEILPVTFEVREEKAEVALMISLDKSYSMKGEKMDLAKEASKAALGELEDEHLFGLVAFDWNTFNIVPLQSAANRTEIAEQISRIEASAQTNFYPALESCFRQLSAIEDPSGRTVKHVILVSDGKTYPDDYEGLVRRMFDADITVSTVAVGLEADIELLQRIAQWGHGRSYVVQDAARVQRILLEEARSKLEDTLVEESTTVTEASSHPVLAGIDIAGAPDLAGHVAYRKGPGAEVLLATEDDQPILARRRVGLGESWVFASDLSDRWSAPWLEWPGFAPLVSQVLHAAAQGPFLPPVRFSVERSGDRVDLVARLRSPAGGRTSGTPVDGARVEVALGGTAGDATVPLSQSAPGEYRGEVRLTPDPSGDARFELLVAGEPVALASVYHPGTDELAPLPADLGTLRHIAEETGGVSWDGDQLSRALESRPREVVRSLPLWRWLLAVAALLYLLELALHRLGLLDESTSLEESAGTA